MIYSGSTNFGTFGFGSGQVRDLRSSSSEWYMSEREHLHRVVSIMVKAGMEIRFSRPQNDPQSGWFCGVYARARGHETLLGTCGTDLRAELEELIKRERPEAAPEPRPVQQRSAHFDLLDKEICELQADWSLMTEDARKSKLAKIHERLRGMR